MNRSQQEGRPDMRDRGRFCFNLLPLRGSVPGQKAELQYLGITTEAVLTYTIKRVARIPPMS